MKSYSTIQFERILNAALPIIKDIHAEISRLYAEMCTDSPGHRVPIQKYKVRILSLHKDYVRTKERVTKAIGIIEDRWQGLYENTFEHLMIEGGDRPKETFTEYTTLVRDIREIVDAVCM